MEEMGRRALREKTVKMELRAPPAYKDLPAKTGCRVFRVFKGHPDLPEVAPAAAATTAVSSIPRSLRARSSSCNPMVLGRLQASARSRLLTISRHWCRSTGIDYCSRGRMFRR
jgi:hypothetical protein